MGLDALQLNLPSVSNGKDPTALEVMKRLENFLTRSSGLPFCAECLAHEAGIGVERARRALVELRQTLGQLRAERRWCARCLRWEEVFSMETA